VHIEERGYHLDINDPRNEIIFEKLKIIKNKELRELLKREEMMPFFDIESLRQKLLKIRYTNPDLLAEKIPMTEEDIANNQRLLDLLEVKIAFISL
jgi:hypothetical protein